MVRAACFQDPMRCSTLRTIHQCSVLHVFLVFWLRSSAKKTVVLSRKTHPSVCFVQVLFHVNNGAGRITATYEPRASRTLCDGKWHTLRAQKSKHRIALTVDGNPVRAESPHTHSTSADTNDPIYVGGYPGMYDSSLFTYTGGPVPGREKLRGI